MIVLILFWPQLSLPSFPPQSHPLVASEPVGADLLRFGLSARMIAPARLAHNIDTATAPIHKLRHIKRMQAPDLGPRQRDGTVAEFVPSRQKEISDVNLRPVFRPCGLIG